MSNEGDNVGLEDLKYHDLRRKAIEYGVAVEGNPKREYLIGGLRDVFLKMDEPVVQPEEEIVDAGKYERTPREVPEVVAVIGDRESLLEAQKVRAARAPGKNFVRCSGCGNTHVPGQFLKCAKCDKPL